MPDPTWPSTVAIGRAASVSGCLVVDAVSATWAWSRIRSWDPLGALLTLPLAVMLAGIVVSSPLIISVAILSLLIIPVAILPLVISATISGRTRAGLIKTTHKASM